MWALELDFSLSVLSGKATQGDQVGKSSTTGDSKAVSGGPEARREVYPVGSRSEGSVSLTDRCV